MDRPAASLNRMALPRNVIRMHILAEQGKTSQSVWFALDRLHRNCQQIIYQRDFFLHERLAVTHSGQESVVGRHGGDSLPDLDLGEKQPATGRLILILRP